MSRLKKFFIVFFSFLPFSAGAWVGPLVVALVSGAGVLAGFSIYRSSVPVDMVQAMKFFSSCWSCQMFSDIMSSMSNLLPRIYHMIGLTVIPFAAALTAIWFAWRQISGFIDAKLEKPWDTAGMFTTQMIRLAFVCALLASPLPRMLTSVVIEPIFSVGMSMNHIISDSDEYAKCVVASAIADPASIDTAAANSGAFSPSLRHGLACEIANIHQMTGLGMTVGWTMLNMAFDSDYMHKIMWKIPIFPNVPLFFVGLLILVLFFGAMLPVPLYFLQVFITLSLDLVMLPLMLLSWLFKDWAIFPRGGKTIRGIIDDVVKATAGIAMVGIFVTFSVMFLNAMFGDWTGASSLQSAIEQNDSKLLMDGLMMQNDSLITIVFMGIFIAMFMTMIPTLIKTLFANVSIPTTFYDTAKKDLQTMWNGAKKVYGKLKS